MVHSLAPCKDVVLLVRKGESLSNLGGMLCGHSDPLPTILGRKQANLLFEGLYKDLDKFSGIYSSDLRRCTIFSDIATGFQGAKLVVKDKRLREIDFGSVGIFHAA